VARRESQPQLDSDGRVVNADGTTPYTDLYYYLVRSSWSKLAVLVVAAFVAANTAFALLYWLTGGVEGTRSDSFTDMFFFSVQSMATIGYGVLHPVTFLANVLVSIEALSGLVGLAMMTGLVFAKFSLPTARVRFSKFAVISRRDGVPSLMFRMANLRASRIVEASIHVVFSRIEQTREGELSRRFYDLVMVRERTALFVLTWTAAHQISADSPLATETAESLTTGAAMLTVSLTGLDETFSQTVHARRTYDPPEILWGKRLGDITTFNSDGSIAVDYSRFDDVTDFSIN